MLSLNSEMAQSKLQLALLLAAVASSAGFSIGAGPLRLRSGSQASSVAASTALSSGILMQDTDAGVEASAAPAAYIEFIVGYPEPVVPDVSLTRSRDGSTGVATFTFDNPSFLAAATQDLGETTGMFLKDSEGTMKTSEVTATFTNGKPRIVKGVMVMRGADEWDRFMRFMERYAESNGLGFSKA